MFVNLASDPIVERLLVSDMALKVAERFAVEDNRRVLVLLTDMTAYADALKEIGSGPGERAGEPGLHGRSIQRSSPDATSGPATSAARGRSPS
jgi:vacuolar-type H+-ATPase subunit B/Vma2